MNKNRKTSHILNVFQFDANGHVILPATLTIGENPHSSDNTSKIPSTAWIRTYVTGLSYLTGNQSITVSGDATGSGTTAITLTLANTAVTPGTYGSTTLVPVVTVDSKGRITSVTTAAISGSLTFTGDVTGTGTTGTSTGLTLAASGVTAGTYTKVTVDSKGRVTVGANASTTDISEGTNLYYTDTRVGTYLTANSYATQSYVGTQVANLVAAAPATLDTLNELAAALGNDPSFATTVSTSIGTKVPQTRTLTINGTGYDLSADRSWTINSMVYPGAGIALSTGTAWGTSIIDNSANWNTAYGWGNHASGGYLTSATAATTYASLTGTYANPAFISSLAYSKITGVPAFLTSYTETDPYRVTSVAVSGTSTKTITLTRADASTVTTTWTDIDTDTNTYVTSAGFSGGTLTLTRNDAGTVTVSLDGRYYLASNPSSYITTSSLTWSNISGKPTTLSSFTNDLGNYGGWITGYTETDTLASVTGRGATTSNAVTVGLLIAQGPGGNYNENVRLPGSTAVISFNTSGATGAGSYNIVSQTNFQIRNAGGTQVFVMDQSGNLTMTGTVSGSNLSGTNTGDQTNISGNSATTSQRNFDGSLTSPDFYASGWFRTTGATAGLYNSTHNTHFYASSTGQWNFATSNNSWIQIALRPASHESTVRGYIYADTNNNVGLLTNDGNWGLRVDVSKNVQIYGTDLTVGTSTSSNIYMTDTDETTRRIHCNSGRIGFLNSSNGWGAYCDNSGNWFANNLSGTNTGDQTNISGNAATATYATSAGSAPNASNVNDFYNVTPGLGYGLKFWNSDNYKISMGASGLYYYGPVTDYSIKMQMNDGDTGRGFTWGRLSYAPIAALNSTSGNMQIAGTFTSSTQYVANGNSSATMYGPNATWGASLWVGAASTNNAGQTAQVISTDGNLHLDAGTASKQIYINYYSGMITGIYGGLNMQNTAISNASYVSTNTYVRAGTNVYTDQNYGYGLIGLYSSYRFQGVFAMGDAYKLPVDGTTTGNLYGLAWSHPNAGGQAANLSNHGLLVISNGVTQCALSNYIWALGNITANGNMYSNVYYMAGSTSKYIQNNTTSYTSLYVGGSQGGYSGIRVDGGMNLMMHTNGVGGPVGFWHESVGWSILTYANGDQNLYSNGSLKLNTATYGILVTGEVRATGDITAYYSDIRLKKDIDVIPDAIEKIKKLRGVTYTWNDEEVNVVKKRSGQRDIGLIAQEVEAVEPLFTKEYQTPLDDGPENPDDAVNYNPRMSETYKTIKYDKLVALLVEGMKEQQLQIEELKNKLDELTK